MQIRREVARNRARRAKELFEWARHAKELFGRASIAKRIAPYVAVACGAIRFAIDALPIRFT
jgi:hypothetical protein